MVRRGGQEKEAMAMAECVVVIWAAGGERQTLAVCVVCLVWCV